MIPMDQLQDPSQIEAETSWQRFTVSYAFPVCFTSGLFNPANLVLRDTLCHLETDKRHRIIVFLDDGVIRAMPGLPDAINHYAQAHPQQMELVVPPISMPSGERIKSDLHFIEQMQKILSDEHI